MDLMLENIINLMQEKGISQNELCKRLNLPRSSFSDWKTGRTNSYRKKINEIATILETEPINILGGKSDNDFAISNHEKDLIKLYRMLKPKHKEKIESLILKYTYDILESEAK